MRPAGFALAHAAELQTGETILIVGAAGAVGQAATQIAKWKKARVLGAGRSLNPILGVDAVFDAVGGPMFEPALRSLGIGGRHVVITSKGERHVCFDLVDFYHNRSRLMGVDSMKFTARDIRAIGNELRAGFESNALRAPSIKTVQFAKAIEAYEEIAGGQGGARPVLTFS